MHPLKWITKPLEVLDTYSQSYGDIFTAYVGLGKKPIVLISKPLLPVRRGLLLAPPDDFQMKIKRMRHQNQQVFQTSSISG